MPELSVGMIVFVCARQQLSLLVLCNEYEGTPL